MRNWIKQLFSATAAGTEQASEQATKTAPTQAAALAADGKAALVAGDFAAAVEYYRAAIAAQPDDATLHLNLGFALKQASQHEAARASLEQVLRIDPRFPDAHYLLGALAIEQGDAALTAVHWQQALASAPDFEIVYLELSQLLLAQGDAAAARSLLQQGSTQLPQSADLHFYLGNALLQHNERDPALHSYRRAVALNPAYREAHSNLGSILQGMGAFDEAVACMQAALAVDPLRADAHYNLAVVLQAQGKLEPAALHYRRAVAIEPGHIQALFNLGTALEAQRQFAEAADAYRAALARKPDFADALCNLGRVLQAQALPEPAMAAYQAALGINPQLQAARINLAEALQDAGRYEEAIACCAEGLAIAPGDPGLLAVQALALLAAHRFDGLQQTMDALRAALDAAAEPAPTILINYANLKTSLMQQEEALAIFDRALSIAPDSSDAHFGKSHAMLAMGDFKNGWSEYEYRWYSDTASDKPALAGPEWDGKAELQDKTIVLHAEQGYGDTLQFIRYAGLLAQRGARVLVLAPAPLQTLLASCPGVAQVFSAAEMLPPFDTHCALLSLPLLLGTELNSIPAPIPYLHGTAAKQTSWRERLDANHGRPRAVPSVIRVGLAWAGNPANAADRARSMHFQQWLPLLDAAGLEFFSLQLGDAAAQLNGEPRVIDYTAALHDFDDTAALMAQLDLVISVDTAVVHLAGALGKPVWLLNRYNSCWRWLAGRDDSPWYPTMRLFRQPGFGDWDSVMDGVVQALVELAASHRNGNS